MFAIKNFSYCLSRNLICFFLILFLTSPGYTQSPSPGTTSNIKSLLSDRGQVLFGDEPNSLMVIDYPENIKKVEDYLEMVDVVPQQVHIEARIVEVKLQKETSLGIDWSLFAASGGLNFGNFDMYSASASEGIRTTGVIDYDTYSRIKNPPISGTTTSTTPFTLTLAQNNINMVMRALANEYNIDILSAPSVTTVNNHEATIQMTDIYPWAEPTVTPVEGSNPEISWQINFAEAGITLKVTPTISADGKIIMDLIPEISEKTDDYSLSTTSGSTTITYTIPIIETRQAKTRVVVGSSDTLVIGGLIKNKEVDSEIKIPLLGDIPYIGYLFKSQRKTVDKRELVIFVSPTIINAPEIEYGSKLEKKVRKDVEGDKTKLSTFPLKETGLKSVEKEMAQVAEAEAEKELLNKKINALYSRGVTLYFEQQFKKAEAMFKEVLRYDPDHKGALSYLEEKLPAKLNQLKIEKTEEAKSAGSKEPEKVVYQKPVDSKKTEAVQKQPEQQKQPKESKQPKLEQPSQAQVQKSQQLALKEKTKNLYRQAVSLYRDKKYNEAFAKFQEADSLVPGYQRSGYYLTKIPGIIEAEKNKIKSEQEAAARKKAGLKAKELYNSAATLYRQKRYLEAYAKFQEADSLVPGYQRSGYYLTKIPELIEQQQTVKRAKEARGRELAIQVQVKQAYRVAVSLYKAGSYPEAYQQFSEVQKLMPGYRETAYYLNKIPEILEKKQKADQLRFEKNRNQAIKDMLKSCE